MKFIASRLSDNNKLFPSEIHIEESGILVKIPNLFKGKSEYFAFDKISNVSIETPLLGYSTITFHASRSRVSVHGFTKKEVGQIKKAIENGNKPKKIVREKSLPQQKNFITDKGSAPLQTQKLSEIEQIELEKKELELLYLRKEKELEWQTRLNTEKQKERLYEIDFQKRLEIEKEKEKRDIIEKDRVWGHLIVFWKYSLDKIWKKIVFAYFFVYFMWLIISSLSDVLFS